MSKAETVAPDVRRILAPNPSALTFQGTNTYLIGSGEVAVIDPGPDSPQHLEAMLAALGLDDRVSAILVTHAHLDHSGLAARLQQETGAPIYAAGTATDGRSPTMQALADSGLIGGGEGLDMAFVPDHRLAHGQVVAGRTWELEAIATPGHLGSHMAFRFEDVVFSGDHVMGWSTTIVSPPDGDMGAYMASLERLARVDARLYLPGHGPEIETPSTRVSELVQHRRARESAILNVLRAGPATAVDVAAAVYTDVAPELVPAATRNVLAHLIDLCEKGLGACEGPISVGATFHLSR